MGEKENTETIRTIIDIDNNESSYDLIKYGEKCIEQILKKKINHAACKEDVAAIGSIMSDTSNEVVKEYGNEKLKEIESKTFLRKFYIALILIFGIVTLYLSCCVRNILMSNPLLPALEDNEHYSDILSRLPSNSVDIALQDAADN